MFSKQIKEWVAKIAHLDYDAMANLVSEFEELKQQDLSAFVLGRSKNSRPLMEKASSLSTTSLHRPRKLNDLFRKV